MTRWLLPTLILALLLASSPAVDAQTEPPVPPPPTPTPPNPQPDLAVVDLDLAGPTPAWNFGKPTNSTVRVIVTNRADAGTTYRLFYYWVNATTLTEEFLNEDDISSFDASEDTPIPKNAQRTHFMTWRVQPNQVGAGFVRAYVEPAGGSDVDLNWTDNHADHARFIARRMMSLEVNQTDLQIAPGETRFLRVMANNTGNVEIATEVFLLNPEMGNNSRFQEILEPSKLNVPPAQGRNATLYVKFPYDGDDRNATANYSLQARTAYGLPINASTPRFVSNVSHQTTGYAHDFRRLEAPPAIVEAGRVVNARFRLTNTGIQNESYVVRATAGPGWTVTPASQRFALLVDERAFMTFSIQAPSGTPPGTATDFTVIADGDHGVRSPPSVMPIRVSGAFFLLKGVTASPDPAYKGDAPSALVTVANPGDLSSQPRTLSVAAEAVGSPRKVADVTVPAIAPFSTSTVTVPLDPLTHGGWANLSAAWADDPDSDAVKHSFFVHEPKLVVTAPTSLEGSPGEDVGYSLPPKTFRVRNVGNAEEAIDLFALSDTGAGYVSGDSQIILAPGQERHVAVIHRLPRPANEAANARLTLVAAVAGQHEFKAEAFTTTTIVDRSPPQMSLPATPRTLWSLGEPLPLSVTATDDGSLAKVEATISGPSGPSQTLPMGPQGNGLWIGSFATNTAGNYTVAYRAFDKAGHNASTAPYTVAIRPVAPPVLALDPSMPTGPIEASATFRILIQDPLGIESTVVQQISNGAELSSFAREISIVDGVGSFDLAGLEPGPVKLLVEAINTAGARSNLTLELVILPPPPAPGEALQDGAKDTPNASLAWGLLAVAALLVRLRRRP